MPKHATAALALAALVVAQLALAQTATTTPASGGGGDVTSVEFWQNIASGVGKWLRLMFAIAFWASFILLVFYAIMTQAAPSKVFRVAALVDLIESVKTVLLGIFVFTASVTGLVAGVAAIANAFGASFGVSPIDVVNALIFQPIVDMVKVATG